MERRELYVATIHARETLWVRKRIDQDATSTA